MKLLKECIDEWINEKDINYFDYNEFSDVASDVSDYFDYNEFSSVGDVGDGVVKKANWGNRTVLLIKLNNLKITESNLKEITKKLKDRRRVYYHPNINRFFGLTKDSDENYFSVSAYANDGNLRYYLKEKKRSDLLQWKNMIQMALDITRGLMCLHSKKIIHGNLHAFNILVNDGKLKITDFKLFEEATPESINLVYFEPQYLCDPSYKQNTKSDIYSLGFLLWELSSGRPPFSKYSKHSLAQIRNGILKGKREDPVGSTPSEYQDLYKKCWKEDPNERPKIGEVFEILSRLKSQELPVDSGVGNSATTSDIDSFTDVSTEEIAAEIFKNLKLNHGLLLYGYNVQLSERTIFKEDVKFNINVYRGQPIVCTNINASDACINFPIAEITYESDLLKSFQECMDDDDELNSYFFARKILIGGKLFIKEFNSATLAKIDILKYYLFCVYNSAKYSTEIQFNNLFALNLLPKIETSGGKELNTHEELADWMKDLYKNNAKLNLRQSVLNLIQKGRRCLDKSIDKSNDSIIITHGNLIPIFPLTSSVDDEQPRTAIFKEESLEKWAVGVVGHGNLISCARDFHLFRGLIINENYEVESSEKIAINFIKIPEDDNFSKKSYLQMIKPATNLEVFLISNNIFSIKDLSNLPFITLIKSNDESYKDYNHILVKREQQEILLNMDIIKPTKEFEQAVEKALHDMKPLKALQDIFNEYGHLFPQRVILGRSLKNITSSTLTNKIDKIDLNSPILESLRPYLNDLKISYFLTPKGKIIENDDLPNWIQNTNNLEIVEFDEIIPLYKILEAEQQSKIDDILKKQDNYKIIMTGITDLKDLDENKVKRVNVVSSLEDKDYKVFGSVISEDNFKLKGVYVKFGSHDFNGFNAIVKKLEGNDDLSKCHVLWMIIGKPSKLSVFSPNNREFQVRRIKNSITLRPNVLSYNVETPTLRSEDTILIDVSTNCELNNIKLVDWKDEYIDVEIIRSQLDENLANIGSDINIDLDVYILSTDSTDKRVKLDNKEGKKYSLNLIGFILTLTNENSNDDESNSINSSSNLISSDRRRKLKSIMRIPFMTEIFKSKKKSYQNVD